MWLLYSRAWIWVMQAGDECSQMVGRASNPLSPTNPSLWLQCFGKQNIKADLKMLLWPQISCLVGVWDSCLSRLPVCLFGLLLHLLFTSCSGWCVVRKGAECPVRPYCTVRVLKVRVYGPLPDQWTSWPAGETSYPANSACTMCHHLPLDSQ